MSDWRSKASSGDWRSRAMSSGGAMGGPGGNEPINPSADIPPAETPVDPREVAVKEADAEQRRMQLAAEMSHGQSLAHAPDAERKAFHERSNAGAAAEALSFARGASGPFGAHLDEMTGALKSGRLSGPEYEREKLKAQQTLDAATGHAPVAPIIGAMMLPQPQGAFGRVALNTAVGASEGVGDAKTLEGAPTEAMKKAAVAAVMSILSEGIAKGAKGSGGAMKRASEEQALKAAGARGGISDQLDAYGLRDMDDARDLGRRALDEGLIPFGGSKEAVLERARALRGQSGSSIGAELTRGDVSGVPFDYDELGNAALEPYNKADAVLRRAGNKSLDLADSLAEQGKLTPGTFSGAQRAKSSAWDAADFRADAKGAKRLYKQSVGAAAGNIKDQLRRAVGDDAADAYEKANAKFQTAADIEDLSREASRREGANSTFGLREQLLMAAGIGGGVGQGLGHGVEGVLTGAATAWIANVAKRRGNAAAAVALDKLKALGIPLDMAGDLLQRGEAAVPVESRPKGMLDEYLRLLERSRK